MIVGNFLKTQISGLLVVCTIKYLYFATKKKKKSKSKNKK